MAWRYLRTLIEQGVVLTDPPGDQLQGKTITFHVNREILIRDFNELAAALELPTI